MNDLVKDRLEALAAKRRTLPGLPPEQALEVILSDTHPAALVHSMSEEDLYFLVHDIGPEDSLELLGLASGKQWDFFLDMEIWDRDRLDLGAATRWLGLLIQAAPDRLLRWVLEEKLLLMEYYLFHTLETAVREHDQDPSELGDGFVTRDDVFYFKPRNLPVKTPEKDASLPESRETFLNEFLYRLAADDHVVYQKVLLEYSSVIPAEIEEEEYRLCTVRRAEKGFLPFEEAVGVYQTPPFRGLSGMRKKVIAPYSDPTTAVPVTPARMLPSDTLFSVALSSLDSDAVLEQLQTEFAGLCNQVISADGTPVRDRKALAGVVRKVCGYLSMGLETLTGEKKDSGGRTAFLIRSYPLVDFFRLGYGEVRKLKSSAETWRKQSWFETQELPLHFWGENGPGVIGGLLIPKPMYYDNYRTGVLYRDFASLSDIRETEKVISDIRRLDRMFNRMTVSGVVRKQPNLSWKSLLLTLWARHWLGLEAVPLPIPLPVFRRRYAELWASGDVGGNKIKDEVKVEVLGWIAEKTGLDLHDLSRDTGTLLEGLFQEVEEEFGAVSGKDLDPRFTRLFLLS